MANKTTKWKVEIEALFKGDKAKKNAENMASDIETMLQNMWDPQDGAAYFKNLMQYIGMIDSAMDAFRREHGDDADAKK